MTRKSGPSRAPENSQWTLIRGARQLLTLRGASGPRRASAMADLNVIQDGAILIRDGLIEEVGTTRRVENLIPSRLAKEIDAAGKVVMPAFVDPDMALASPASGGHPEPGSPSEPDISRMSRRRLEGQAALVAADLARYGVLTIGAHTLSAPDLPNTRKALRLYQTMQSRPLRIRAIFSAPPDADDSGSRRVNELWLPAIFRKRLASLLEICVAPGRLDDSRAMAEAAAVIGYNIRFRVGVGVGAPVEGVATTKLLELAHAAGAVAIIGSVPANTAVSAALADAGCVQIVLQAHMLAGDVACRRSVIDAGIPVALASGYRHDITASMNPQFLLFTACGRLGMTVEEAIVAATYNASCSLRLSHVTGSLSPGKSADICIVDVDDYREMARRAGHHDVSLVLRAGKIVYRRPNLTLE